MYFNVKSYKKMHHSKLYEILKDNKVEKQHILTNTVLQKTLCLFFSFLSLSNLYISFMQNQ